MWLDYLLYFTYAIIVATLALSLFFAFRGMSQNLKSSMISLIGTGVVLLLFLAVWFLTDGQEITSSTGVVLATAGQSHFVSAGLNIFYILISGTVLAAVYSAVSSALKK